MSDHQSSANSTTPSCSQPTDASASPIHRASERFAWLHKWRHPVCAWLGFRRPEPPDDIDGMAQEVYSRLLRYSDDVAVENPKAYLFKVASTVAGEWRERARVSKPSESRLDDLKLGANSEPSSAPAKIKDPYVQAAVNQLPPPQRDALLLRVDEGLTYKEIAARQKLPNRIVLRNLKRAYGNLRIQLWQKGT